MAQTLLHFTENKNYDKYIRLLCNIMMLSLVVLPVMELFHGNTSIQVEQLINLYEEQLSDIEEKNKELQEKKEMQITQSMQNKEQEPIPKGIQNIMQQEIAKEMKDQLNHSKLAEQGYQVTRIVIHGVKEDGTWDAENYAIQIDVEEASQKGSAMKEIKETEWKEEKDEIEGKDEKGEIEGKDEIEGTGDTNETKRTGEIQAAEGIEKITKVTIGNTKKKQLSEIEITEKKKSLEKLCAKILETNEVYVEVNISG